MLAARGLERLLSLGLLLGGCLFGGLKLILKRAPLLFELRDARFIFLVALCRGLAIALKPREPLAKRAQLTIGRNDLFVEIGTLTRGGKVLLAKIDELFIALGDLITEVEALFILFIELLTEIEDLTA